MVVALVEGAMAAATLAVVNVVVVEQGVADRVARVASAAWKAGQKNQDYTVEVAAVVDVRAMVEAAMVAEVKAAAV